MLAKLLVGRVLCKMPSGGPRFSKKGGGGGKFRS